MERLLDVEEIAEFLRVKPGTIYQWTHEGYIPYIKIGKLLRFRRSKILKWLENKSTNGRKTRKVDVRELGV
jgi:excisionase family DNA binding protein